jgi:hypothetical protein
MATRIIQRACRLCEDGVVDITVTDHYDSSGAVIDTTEDKRKCRKGCLGRGCDFCPPEGPAPVDGSFQPAQLYMDLAVGIF